MRERGGTFSNVDYQELKFEFNWVVCCHQTLQDSEYEYFCKMAHSTINGIFKMHLDPGTDQNLSILYLVCCIFDVFFLSFFKRDLYSEKIVPYLCNNLQLLGKIEFWKNLLQICRNNT